MVFFAGFLGYPQPGGGTHPPIPREGVLWEVLGGWANLALRQAHKNARSRVVRAAGAQYPTSLGEVLFLVVYESILCRAFAFFSSGRPLL